MQTHSNVLEVPKPTYSITHRGVVIDRCVHATDALRLVTDNGEGWRIFCKLGDGLARQVWPA